MLIGSLRVRKIVARLLPTNKGVEFAWPLLYCRTDRETVVTLELLQNLMQKGWLQFSEISLHCKVKYVASFLSPTAKVSSQNSIFRPISFRHGLRTDELGGEKKTVGAVQILQLVCLTALNTSAALVMHQDNFNCWIPHLMCLTQTAL